MPYNRLHYGLLRMLVVCVAAVCIAMVLGCGGGSSTSSPPPVKMSATVTLAPSQAASATVNNAQFSTTLAFPAHVVNQQASANISLLNQEALPAPITKTHSRFTAETNNVFVLAFTISLNPSSINLFNAPVSLSGSLTTAFHSGLTLNLAMWQGNAWVDVATVVMGAKSAFAQNLPSTILPGIMAPGTYVLYQPASGTSTAVSNLGVALAPSDGRGQVASSLQVINLFDARGNPLATPAINFFTFLGSGYIDEVALTPDGSQGIMVDGDNTLRFFSNLQTGAPIHCPDTLDVTNYGSDTESVAIMPNGDEAVVAPNGNHELLLVSGIVSGTPQAAETIPTPSGSDNRHGLALSNDGNVLLARGEDGVTVYAIAPVTPSAGSLGGTVAHSFTQSSDFPALGSGENMEGGREGMAISPQDSSRAVVVGPGDSVQLLTGLPNAPALRSKITLKLPAPRRVVSPPHRAPSSISGVKAMWSVSITADGTEAIVGTDAGLVLLSGVNTGNLTQVGTIFAPTFQDATGATLTLGPVTTLGITLDGKYVAACTPGANSNFNNGTLLVIPFAATGFGTPVGQLNGIAVTDNDQMMMH